MQLDIIDVVLRNYGLVLLKIIRKFRRVKRIDCRLPVFIFCEGLLKLTFK